MTDLNQHIFKIAITVIILSVSMFAKIQVVQTQAFYSSISVPFEVRSIDVMSNGTLYAVGWENGSIYRRTPQGQWICEVAPSAGNSSYKSLYVTTQDEVFCSISGVGVYKKNSTGWHLVANSTVSYLGWHWAENPLTGDLYLQQHAHEIWNTTDGGNTWGLMYNMTASDPAIFGTVDTHFHAIAFDSETQTLWASGGDSIDIIRRWNNVSGWEIVASYSNRSFGSLSNLYQATAIMFDEDYVYFGADACAYGSRLDKTITAPANLSDFEIVMSLDQLVYPENQWQFFSASIGGVLFAPTCYNDGIMLVSLDGVHWVAVFNRDGYYLEGYGTPVHPSATTYGGISSMTSRAPIYFVHNAGIYSLSINRQRLKTIYNAPFVQDYGTYYILERTVTSGDDSISFGEGVRGGNLSLEGVSLWQLIENRTFEPNQDGNWTEDGYGTITITSEDNHTGGYCLKDVVGYGTEHASHIFPPESESWNISSVGSGQYFWSVWLRTNVTWTEGGGIQPEFYIGINYRELAVQTNVPVRINITTSWRMFSHSIFIPDTADHVQCYVSIYRENETDRAVYIDDAMFWGALRYSYVDTTRQRFVSPVFASNFDINATGYNTTDPQVLLANLAYGQAGILPHGNGTGDFIIEDMGNLTSTGIEDIEISVVGSNQTTLRIRVGAVRAFIDQWFNIGLGLGGLGMAIGSPTYGITILKKGTRISDDEIERLGILFVTTIMGIGLIIIWLW